MTLLTVEDLERTRRDLEGLDETCRAATGLSPYELGCRAFGLTPVSKSLRQKLKVACVPITAGNGILGDFCHIVAAIVEQLAGIEAFVTQRTDVSGIEDAIWSDADIVFLADDETFVAYNTRTNALSDNSIATGRVFAAVLDCAAGLSSGDEVLVLGAGKVGRGACGYLADRGVSAYWFDAHLDQAPGFDSALRCENWGARSWKHIVEATTASGLVEPSHVGPDSIVSAPGVPFGVSDQAVQRAQLVFHDNLAMGVVAMLCQALGVGGRSPLEFAGR